MATSSKRIEIWYKNDWEKIDNHIAWWLDQGVLVIKYKKGEFIEHVGIPVDTIDKFKVIYEDDGTLAHGPL